MFCWSVLGIVISCPLPNSPKPGAVFDTRDEDKPSGPRIYPGSNLPSVGGEKALIKPSDILKL